MLGALLAFAAGARAQYYTLGADPGNIRWNILKSDHFRVIYPVGMDSLAREYLFNFELARPRTEVGQKIEGAEMPMILHPYTLRSNASVAWAPRRVDVFTTPPPGRGYADSWVHQLALHEGRHISQTTHFTTGTFRPLTWLLGEQAVGLGMGFYPSGWELEGDAVHTETDFSKAGRGRDANFLMPYRAIFLSGDNRSYDQWRFGSYKNYSPSKYGFGYIVETFMRDNAGFYVMGDIYRDFTRRWYDPSIINKAFQKYTGRTRRKNFHGAVDYFTDMWQNDFERRMPYTDYVCLADQNPRYYTQYSYPVAMEGGSVAMVKAALDHASQLVITDTCGREKTLRPFASASLVSPLVSADGNTILWSEIVSHPRWELHDWSLIRSYDLKTHRIRTLTRRTRYFNPAFSPGGERLSVTQYSLDGNSSVVVLDASSMEALGSVAAPGGGQIHSTAWIGGRIYADAILGDGQWGLFSRPADDFGAGWSVEIEPQTRTISHLRADGDSLIFETDLDGVSNIYSYTPSCGVLQKLTNARFGAFDPFRGSDGTLYYTDYDARGYLPVKALPDNLKWEEADFSQPFVFRPAERFGAMADSLAPAMTPERQARLRAEVDSIPAKRYRKAGHLLNIHSWAPLYVGVDRIMNSSFDAIYQVAAPGVTLISQNHLGTAETLLGYSCHAGRHAGHINFKYSGWWPVLEFNADYNDRAKRNYTYSGAAEPRVTDLDEPSLEARVTSYIPVNLSRGGWQSAIIPRAELNFTSDQYHEGCNLHYGGNLQAGVRYYRMLPKTRANRMPRLGIGAEVRGAWSRGAFEGIGQTLYGYTYGYLPGFTTEQGLRLSAMAQKHFGYTDYMPIKGLAALPRGYRDYPMGDYCKFTADYSLPIPINDWHPVPILLYLMRINIVPFVDGALNYMPTGMQKMMSYGSALTLQGHIFRIGWEVEAGARVSRYWDLNQQRWRTRAEFVTGVGL